MSTTNLGSTVISIEYTVWLAHSPVYSNISAKFALKAAIIIQLSLLYAYLHNNVFAHGTVTN